MLVSARPRSDSTSDIRRAPPALGPARPDSGRCRSVLALLVHGTRRSSLPAIPIPSAELYFAPPTTRAYGSISRTRVRISSPTTRARTHTATELAHFGTVRLCSAG